MSETNEGLDHNTAMASIIEHGDDDTVSLILGDRDRLRCGGTIRTGVKTIKSSCSDADKAKFSQLEAQGLPYDEIDRQLGGEPKSKKSKLYPKNVDFFVVRECDFKRPADAQYIREKFADQDGKVRRIPVWFSVPEIDRVIPHNFKAFDGGNNVRAASFYSDGQFMCRFVPKDIKKPKREDWQERPCDPDNCQAHSGRRCVFGGLYRFNIPGLRGFDEIILPTRSWYGMGYSVALLRRVRSILGRFDGLLNGQPFLELVKVEEEVKTPDGRRQTQFIPVLELAVDPMELARYSEPSAVMARANKAMGALSGTKAASQDVPDLPMPSSPQPASEDVQPEADAPLPADHPGDGSCQDETAGDQGLPFGTEDPARGAAMEYLHNQAKWLGVSWEVFVTWVVMDQTSGVSIDDLPMDELRSLAELVKQESKTKPSKEKFAKAMVDVAASVGVENRLAS